MDIEDTKLAYAKAQIGLLQELTDRGLSKDGVKSVAVSVAKDTILAFVNAKEPEADHKMKEAYTEAMLSAMLAFKAEWELDETQAYELVAWHIMHMVNCLADTEAQDGQN